jgi:hypothetical protein
MLLYLGKEKIYTLTKKTKRMSRDRNAFVLALFPPTGILGIGQFVKTNSISNLFGWVQIVTLICQMFVLGLLRTAIVDQSQTISTQDMLEEDNTLSLAIIGIILLFIGFSLYLVGIYKTMM